MITVKNGEMQLFTVIRYKTIGYKLVIGDWWED